MPKAPVTNPEPAAEEVVAYCMRCRAKRPLKNVENVKMGNGRPARKGLCSVCGGSVYRIG